MIKADIKTKIKMPNFDFTSELLTIAEKTVIPDIVGRIDTGQDLNGRVYENLSDKTIAHKAKKGHRLDPLIATGQLRKSFEFKRAGMNKVLIWPSGDRKETSESNADIADILQNQGVRTKKGKRFFEFFGVSEKAEGKAINRIKLYIKRLTRGK
jgi:hypothetical protein